MLYIQFKAKLREINSKRILHIPKESSDILPSRGMVMMKGTINDTYVELALEPDGMGSHWIHISDELLSSIKAKLGDTVSVNLKLMGQWFEPDMPYDFMHAIADNGLMDQWDSLTTKARWEWLRWMRSTENPETRKLRIEKACSMLLGGKRRPCCFNSSACTDPTVSKSGKLRL